MAFKFFNSKLDARSWFSQRLAAQGWFDPLVTTATPSSAFKPAWAANINTAVRA